MKHKKKDFFIGCLTILLLIYVVYNIVIIFN